MDLRLKTRNERNFISLEKKLFLRIHGMHTLADDPSVYCGLELDTYCQQDKILRNSFIQAMESLYVQSTDSFYSKINGHLAYPGVKLSKFYN